MDTEFYNPANLPGLNDLDMQPSSEIGVVTAWDAFDSEPVRVGGNTEIGNTEIGNTEIGEAIRKTLRKARDSRRPAPKMKVVNTDAPPPDTTDDWGLANVFLGAIQTSGISDPYPMLSELLKRFGSDIEPRIIRVDTEKSYKQFRAENSPGMQEMRDRLDALESLLQHHLSDPHAHEAVTEEVESLTALGAAMQEAQQSRQINIWLPPCYRRDTWDAWHDGQKAYSMIKLPASDGTALCCTSAEPLRKSVSEMAHYAADAGVPTSVIMGYLPGLGANLGAGTVMKELAASATDIVNQAKKRGKTFTARIEPKASPTLCALAALARACYRGDKRALDEWQRLSVSTSGSLQQALTEALQVAKTFVASA